MTIEVNRRPWPKPPIDAGDELTYDQVVNFIYPNAKPGEAFRVRYDGAIGPGGKLVSGYLYEGDSIKVSNDTTFTVSRPRET